MRHVLPKATGLVTALLLAGSIGARAQISALPPDIQSSLYNPKMIDPMQPVDASPYKDWKPKKGPPWTIGYASSYAGNTWRAAVMDRLQNVLIPKWKHLGLIKDVIITQSNLRDSVQIQQMRQLVDQGVDAIIVCCSNPTALNQTVRYAHAKGVPVFSAVGYLTSPYSVNSSANFVVGGYMMGQSMAEELHGKGNVLVVQGIPGTSASDSQDKGIHLALDKYPDIKVVGSIAGMWTDQIAQAEIQKWLATHPGELDGIIIQSASEMGALRALQQSGRKMVPITIGGETGPLCYWRKHPDYLHSSIQAWPPGDDFELSWRIMMRTLEGQGPKIESVLTHPIRWTYDDVEKALPADCDENSNGWTQVGPYVWASRAYLDYFFEHPADPEKFHP